MSRQPKKPPSGRVGDSDSLDAFLAEERLRDPEFGPGFETEVDRLAIARMLKGARQARGLSQVELASRAHAHQSNIARLEKGKALPQLEVMKRLAAALGMRLKLRLEPVPRPRRQASGTP